MEFRVINTWSNEDVTFKSHVSYMINPHGDLFCVENGDIYDAPDNLIVQEVDLDNIKD